MKINFDAKKIEKEAMQMVKKRKLEFSCPKCELYIGEYSIKDLENNPEVYCNNCDTLINFNVNF